jgi:hypothetical protein
VLSTHCSPASQQAPLQQMVAQRASLATFWQSPPLQAWQTGQARGAPATQAPS